MLNGIFSPGTKPLREMLNEHVTNPLTSTGSPAFLILRTLSVAKLMVRGSRVMDYNTWNQAFVVQTPYIIDRSV